jgi:hypothetical protein
MRRVSEQAWETKDLEADNRRQNDLILATIDPETVTDTESNGPDDTRTPSEISNPLKDQQQDVISADEKNLVDGYLKVGRAIRVPLHIRRTLDQYYYLGMDSTKQRDEDQVVAKRPLSEILKNLNNSDTQRPSDPEVIMVDQLWLWIIDKGINSLARISNSQSLTLH